MNDIGKNLKELRAASGLTLRELAMKVGISHNTLATYERNSVTPTIHYAVKICEFFKVPVEYLVYGKKVSTDFNDEGLLKLFKEVDEFEEQDRETVKGVLRKLVKNIQERREIEGMV